MIPLAFPHLIVFVATRPEEVPGDASPFLSVDGSVPGYALRWDHHVTGERINLDAMPGLLDAGPFRGVGTTLADVDAVASVVAVLFGGKDRLPAAPRAILESASHWCDHLTPHPEHEPSINRLGRGLLDAVVAQLHGPRDQISARFADACRELAACIQQGTPLPFADTWEQQLRLAVDALQRGRLRAEPPVARIDLRGMGPIDPAALHAQHACPVAVFVEEHPAGGPRYTVGVNPYAASRPADLTEALRRLATAEFAHGAPARSPDPVAGSENWGGRTTVFGSPWNYGSRLSPDEVVRCLVDALPLS